MYLTTPPTFDILTLPTGQGKVGTMSLFSLQGVVSDIVFADGTFFWTSSDPTSSHSGTLWRDATTPTSVVVPPGPTRLAAAGGRIFWLSGIDASGGPSANASIYSASTGVGAGTPTQLTSSTLTQPGGLTADPLFVYWTDLSAGTVNRVAVDADKAAPTVLASGFNGPGAIVNDTTSLYFGTADGTIQKLPK